MREAMSDLRHVAALRMQMLELEQLAIFPQRNAQCAHIVVSHLFKWAGFSFGEWARVLLTIWLNQVKSFFNTSFEAWWMNAHQWKISLVIVYEEHQRWWRFVGFFCFAANSFYLPLSSMVILAKHTEFCSHHFALNHRNCWDWSRAIQSCTLWMMAYQPQWPPIGLLFFWEEIHIPYVFVCFCGKPK